MQQGAMQGQRPVQSSPGKWAQQGKSSAVQSCAPQEQGIAVQCGAQQCRDNQWRAEECRAGQGRSVRCAGWRTAKQGRAAQDRAAGQSSVTCNKYASHKMHIWSGVLLHLFSSIHNWLL